MRVLAELRAICGAAHAAAATSRDALLGSTPRWVVRPSSTDQVAEVMRTAVARQARVVVRGSGSRLHWGPAPLPIDVVLDTSRLTGVVAHHPAQRVATVRAGSRLDTLGDTLRTSRQRLALDPPGPGTVGGAVATGVTGPLAMRHGDARKLILDVTVVRGDGSVVRSGGAASTGIPGYDAAAAVTGGYGALGVVTEVTFQVHPTPPVRRWLVRAVCNPAQVRELVEPELVGHPALAAIEVFSPDRVNGSADEVCLLLEGTAEQVTELVAKLPGPLDADAVRDRPPHWWGRYPFRGDDVALWVSTPPCGIYSAGYTVRDGAGELPLRARWSPGVASLYAALPSDTAPERLTRLVDGVRQTLIARQGSCVVLHAPPRVRDHLDMWGPSPDPALRRRLKHRCDPAGVLAPGRFPA